ncbi:hypothetical protein OENI_110037 [Oenococcus oeni]|nr:hypothetical protein OENI_110037 [Oenococcus oeni]SYW20922.1 hypothetical protein OENI_810003 [Oenococcus oeni]
MLKNKVAVAILDILLFYPSKISTKMLIINYQSLWSRKNKKY